MAIKQSQHKHLNSPTGGGVGGQAIPDGGLKVGKGNVDLYSASSREPRL